MDKTRRAGVLMPVSSLYGKYGIGTLGKSAYDFISWLKKAKVKVWQTLPLLPTNYGDSPYQSCDSHALNQYFIDFELLKDDGLLSESDYSQIKWCDNDDRVDYNALFLNKAEVLKKAFSRFDKTNEDWLAFINKGEYLDFAVFMALKCKNEYAVWTNWGKYADYNQQLIDEFIKENLSEVQFWQFTQFIFLKQWNALKTFANKNGIEIMGDMPIYVAYDSVEMWKYGKELFLVDENSRPTLVAGVPPDAFSDDGQLWGNPVYDWQKMSKNGYLWWQNRIKNAFSLFDIVRIDHFRGFDRFYAIPSNCTNAKNGEWMQGPSANLFKGLNSLSIVAEDLGIIDDGVRNMLAKTGYPGMKVLSFAFDGTTWNEHKPSNYTENYVAYTGTHDNLPLRGYIDGLSERNLAIFDDDLKTECLRANVVYNGENSTQKCLSAVRLLMASRAFLAIVPMQDILAKGSEARINFPSTVSTNNWSYRFTKDDFSDQTAEWLSVLIEENGRFI